MDVNRIRNRCMRVPYTERRSDQQSSLENLAVYQVQHRRNIAVVYNCYVEATQ
jgi:hypothetical protein